MSVGRQSWLNHKPESAVSVVRIASYSCQDTINILKFLLSLALKGKLRGLAIRYREDDGQETSVFTGLYKEHQQHRFNAALMLADAEVVDSR